jgi:hypothetical protein
MSDQDSDLGPPNPSLTIRRPGDPATSDSNQDIEIPEKRRRVYFTTNRSPQNRLRVWTAAAVSRKSKAPHREVVLSKLSPAQQDLHLSVGREEWESWTSHNAATALTAEEERNIVNTVDPSRILRARCVRTNKNAGKPDLDYKAKARLCILGFLDPDVDLRTDAPTTSRSGVRTLIALGAGLKLTMFAGDVSSAFLNG